jgi:tetrapyrrole methylase family protein / MazG family protein
MAGITLLGLGPGDPKLLTREAWSAISEAKEIWLRTRQHPTVASLPPTLSMQSFDYLYENGGTFEEVYRAIIAEVMRLGRRPQGVLYAVPGDPFVAESTCREIAKQAEAEVIPCRSIAGVSFLEPTFAALGIDPLPRLIVCDAMAVGSGHVPDFPPDAPVLIAQVYSKMVASDVKSTLNDIYPDLHPVRLIHAAGTVSQLVEHLALHEVDQSPHIGALTSMYILPLSEGTSFEAFQEVVAHLRAPDGCPWDKEQTHTSLRSHLLEEAYEAISAMDAEDFAGMREEFGDLLLQIVLNAQIAAEEGEFTINDVIRDIFDKIVHRHPHVFGEVKIDGVEGVWANWEKLKEGEREQKNSGGGLLEGVPSAMPSLSQSQQYQDRAARVGFDWPEIQGVLDKIAEEIQEVQDASDPAELEDELGDLFFALVNLARWKKVDAESALRGANLKFRRRFKHIEEGATAQGKRLSELSLDEMEALWQSAKKHET